jgi:hypothetical protein
MNYKLLLLLLLSAILNACKKSEKENEVKPTEYNVQYNIGCSDCMVAYVADTAENQQTEQHQNSNWTYSFKAKKNQQVLLLAYNTSSSPQGVYVKITLNDSILQERTTYCPISGVSFVVDTLQ